MVKNKLINKLVLGFYAFIILTVQICTISNADVAWEPQNNFFKHHADECRRVKEDLITNGYGGKVVIWESPVSDREIDSIENGTWVFVGYEYTDKRGYNWGLVDNGGKTGWAPMDYLEVEPGLRSFSQKHSDEVQKFSGNYELPDGTDKLYFWTYPGSGEITAEFPVDSDEHISIHSSYTDKDGMQWGYVNYFYTHDGWICMSDPSNDQIPVNEEDAADAVMPPEPTVIIKPQPEGPNIVILVAILVVVVGAGTGILIRILFRGKAAKSAAAVTTADAAKASDEQEIK